MSRAATLNNNITQNQSLYYDFFKFYRDSIEGSIEGARTLAEFISQIAGALAYLPGRYACHNGIWLHILGNHTSGAAYRPFPYMYPGQNGYVRADPCSVVYFHRKFFPGLVFIAPELRITMVVLKRIDRHIARQIYVIAQRQPISRVKKRIVADDTSCLLYTSDAADE